MWDEVPRWSVYLFVLLIIGGAVLWMVVGIASYGGGSIHSEISFEKNPETGSVKITVEETYVITETIYTGVPLVGECKTDVTKHQIKRLNITTSQGGGTGEFLDGYESGETVILERAEQPNWRSDGEGEYAAGGDIISIDSAGTPQGIFETHETEDIQR
jgi:hypothetical protein